MPIFEYVCGDCQGRFETLQTAAQSGRAVCPACGSAAAKLQFSVFATSGTGTSSTRAGASSAGGCGCGSSCGCH